MLTRLLRRDHFMVTYIIMENMHATNRYFLASFIQAQIFEGLCKVTVFGTVDTKQRLPMPLHRCDIYGSKNAGKLLQ